MIDPENDPCWHLLVTTSDSRRGIETVNILKNMDADTARKAYQKLMPHTRPEVFINQPTGETYGWSSRYSKYMWNGYGHRNHVEIIGPDDVKLDPWKNVRPFVYDLQEEFDKWCFENQEEVKRRQLEFDRTKFQEDNKALIKFVNQKSDAVPWYKRKLKKFIP